MSELMQMKSQLGQMMNTLKQKDEMIAQQNMRIMMMTGGNQYNSINQNSMSGQNMAPNNMNAGLPQPLNNQPFTPQNQFNKPPISQSETPITPSPQQRQPTGFMQQPFMGQNNPSQIAQSQNFVGTNMNNLNINQIPMPNLR